MVTRLGLRKDDIIVFELDINCFHFTLIRATPPPSNRNEMQAPWHDGGQERPR
jgi:hypothetical protein